MRVDNKVFVVTGAGSGMGRELTLQLTARGARVAAIDMRAAALAETKSLAGVHVATFVLDVTNPTEVSALPARVLEAFGQVDGLINNAGIIQPFVKIKDLSFEDANHVMSVNFTGPLMMTKAFLPLLLNRPEAHILNVSSMGAYTPVPGQSLYGASKAAIKLLTEGLASELKGTKVGVTVVFPGAINTDIASNSGLKVPAQSGKNKIKTTEPVLAAKLMVDAIESGRLRLFIGRDARMMDILTRLSPGLAATLIYRQMRQLLR